MKFKINSGIKEVLLHLLAWIIILSVNVSIFGGYFGHDKNMYELFFMINYPIWLIYISLFYINYLFLIPRFLFNQEYLVFFISSLLLLSLCYVGVQEYKFSAKTIDKFMSLPVSNNIKKHNRHSFKQINYYKKDEVKKPIKHLYTPFNPEFNTNDDSKKRNITCISATLTIDALRYNKDTKRQWYGDFLFSRNTNVGIATVKRMHTPNKYNFNDLRSTTQIYLLLLIYAISLAAGFAKKTVQRNKIIDDINREKMESELSYLKQQINPHFLFNALNSIYSLVLPHSDTASDAVIKLSSILRYMLYETDKTVVSLEKEIEIIKDYIALQSFKFTDITDIKFGTYGSPVGYTIEPLILLPLVENAYKYGADNITPSFIHISTLIADGEFIFKVKNKVVVTKNNSESSGIGIKNIKRRLDLIYNEAYELDIKQSDDVYNVMLKIKLQ